MKSLVNRLNSIVSQLVMVASFEHQSAPRIALRKLLCLQPTLHAVLLYQGGFIKAAKKITDKRRYKNRTMLRIVARMDAIYLALSHWETFADSLSIGHGPKIVAGFNNHVLMVVNSCSGFDKNGYAERSVQLGNVLRAESMSVEFCARLGYPWDMYGRDDWPRESVVDCDEGKVVLRYDPEWLVGGSDPEYWRAYASYIADTVTSMPARPGVLHAHSKYSNAIAAVIAGRKLGIPVVYEMRGLWHLTRAQREPSFDRSDFFQYEEKLEIWAAELADKVVVISETQRDWLIDKGITKTKIHIIPNAINVEQAGERPVSQPLSSPKIRLAFMGSLTAYEGIDTVLEALKLLNSSGHTATLNVFGDGRSRKSLEDLSNRLKLQNAVTFHGRVTRTEILSQMRNYDIFPIVRKDSELTRLIPPLKQLEPMLNGRVVLISALPALIKNVPDCIAELAIPPDNPAALANLIIELTQHPERMNDIGARSKEWVMSKRNWRDNALLYRELYSML
jgi:glycosyltransferase involved in cell wall biosynthesis